MFNKEQQAAYNAIYPKMCNHANLRHSPGYVPEKPKVLSGKPGRGKTYLVGAMIRELMQTFPSLKVWGLAPTHMAKEALQFSLGFPCRTYAAGIGAKREIDPYNGECSFEQDTKKVMQIMQNLPDIVVIDECSMLPTKVLNAMMSIYKKCFILFLGDKAQLLPVKDKISKVFDYETFFLSQNMRAVDSHPVNPIIDALYEAIMQGKEFDVDALAQVECLESEVGNVYFSYSVSDMLEFYDRYPDALSICYSNKYRNTLNAAFRNREFSGNTEPLLEGERLICYSLWNSPDRDSGNIREWDLYNGERLVVSSKYKDSVTIKIEDLKFTYTVWMTALKDKMFYVPIHTPESYEKHQQDLATLARLVQNKKSGYEWWQYYKLKEYFPIIEGGWATTSHKAQGQTYQNGIVHWNNISSVSGPTLQDKYRSLYVGISRFKGNILVQMS